MSPLAWGLFAIGAISVSVVLLLELGIRIGRAEALGEVGYVARSTGSTE